MPEITPLGWFHTAMGIIAIVSGIYTLAKFKEISFQVRSGQIYLLTTLVTAATALGIYQFGEFGVAHGLAVLTLGALAVGTVAAMTGIFGAWSRYVQAIGYSGTLFFHSIPAVTDGLLRLPVGNPILTSIDDPVLAICYGVLLVIFLLGTALQFRWIGKNPAMRA